MLGFIFGVLQMLLYLKYKNADKIITSSTEQKLPDLSEAQIIDIVKFSATILHSDKIPVAAKMKNINGDEASRNNRIILSKENQV